MKNNSREPAQTAGNAPEPMTPIDVPLHERAKEELLTILGHYRENLQWYVEERNKLVEQVEAFKREQKARIQFAASSQEAATPKCPGGDLCDGDLPGEWHEKSCPCYRDEVDGVMMRDWEARKPAMQAEFDEWKSASRVAEPAPSPATTRQWATFYRCGKNMGNDLLVIPCDLEKDHDGPCERNVWPVSAEPNATPKWERQESCPECDGDGCNFCGEGKAEQTVAYWKMRAEAAELKVLTFNEEIMKLRIDAPSPATKETPPINDELIAEIARELYDRFLMGGWEPQDAYPQIRTWLSYSSATPAKCEKCNAKSAKEACHMCIGGGGNCPIVDAGWVKDWPTQVEFEDAQTASSQGPAREETPQWVIVSDGEGAQACVIIDGDLHEAVHKFMCCCGKSWHDCEADMRWDIEQLDSPDNWSNDEAGKPFSMTWPHETGKIRLYKLSKPFDAGAKSVVAAPQLKKCRNPHHACTDGTVEPHELGASCMAEIAAPQLENARVTKFDVQFANGFASTCDNERADIYFRSLIEGYENARIKELAGAAALPSADQAAKIVIEEINSSTGPTGGWLDSPKAVCAEIVARLHGANKRELPSPPVPSKSANKGDK